MKQKELAPIKTTSDDFSEVEEAIRELLLREIYKPLMKLLGKPLKTLQNATDDLIQAILSGRIVFYRGEFKGQFNSTLSRELRRLGAKWDRRQGSYKIPLSSLSPEIKNTIYLSDERMKQTLRAIDRKLAEVQPAEIAERLNLSQHFDRAMFRVEKKIQDTLKNITISPKLTKEQKEKIAEEYTNNARLAIRDFTDKEVDRLRKTMQKAVFQGNRYESMVSAIQKSYGVSESRAKFIARQETNLLLSKYKESRYVSAGVMEYRWTCVAGSPNHPVRPMHKMLDGKVFSWNNPPIVNQKGERMNPGEDFNCRCTARPIVKF